MVRILAATTHFFENSTDIISNMSDIIDIIKAMVLSLSKKLQYLFFADTTAYTVIQIAWLADIHWLARLEWFRRWGRLECTRIVLKHKTWNLSSKSKKFKLIVSLPNMSEYFVSSVRLLKTILISTQYLVLKYSTIFYLLKKWVKQNTHGSEQTIFFAVINIMNN